MPDAKSADSHDDRQQLEDNANALRTRLALTLESLDRRRHDALSLKVQARRHPLPLVLAGTGALVAIAGGTGLSIYRARHRTGGPLAERLRAVSRAWQHPNRVAHPDKRPLAYEIARGVLVALATFAISQLAKQGLVKLFPSLKKKAQPE
jgi:hypothetical protein